MRVLFIDVFSELLRFLRVNGYISTIYYAIFSEKNQYLNAIIYILPVFRGYYTPDFMQ